MHLTPNGEGPQAQENRRQWHALYTRHQHEKQIARMLSGKGHEVFLPLGAATRQWRDRTKYLCLPLFPSYVFIRGGLDRRLQILSTPGVFSLVGWPRPAVIPEAQIESVRKMTESLIPVQAHPYLMCGERVRIKAGALLGLEGILVRKRKMSRFVISLDLLGRSAAVEIDVSCLETMNPGSGGAQGRSTDEPSLN